MSDEQKPAERGPWVMILRGAASASGYYEPTDWDGQYLRDFDFEAHGGQGLIDMTPDLTKARQFATLADAIRFRAQQPACRPMRADGYPNRPLTATNWEFVCIAPEHFGERVGNPA
jgi:hypothetical protein